MEKFVILFILSLATAACTPTTIETMPASLGMPATMSNLSNAATQGTTDRLLAHVTVLAQQPILPTR